MTHRVQRVQELIRRELGPIMERNFAFPGCIVTVHDIDVSPDLKQCFVYVGILGKGEPVESIIKKLNSGRGLIQRNLYKRVVLKNSPILTFKADESVERGVRVLNLIQSLPTPTDDTAPDLPPSDDQHA
jgi:ribosome-binding factor A